MPSKYALMSVMEIIRNFRIAGYNYLFNPYASECHSSDILPKILIFELDNVTISQS